MKNHSLKLSEKPVFDSFFGFYCLKYFKSLSVKTKAFRKFFLLIYLESNALQIAKILSKSVVLFVHMSGTPRDYPYEKWTFLLYPISRSGKKRDELTILAYRLGLVLHETIILNSAKFCFREKC
jgi:hypothetical protein